MTASTNPNAKTLLCGIDIGGTKTEACLMEYHSVEEYKVLARERIPTERNQTYESFIKNLASLVTRILKTAPNGQQVASVGIGIPGTVDPHTQIMVQGSIPFLKDKDIKEDLKRALNLSVEFFCENDANCFALAETYLGSGRSWAKANQVSLNQLCLIGVTLGTGVGGGLIVNGKLIRGRRGGAGEIGHITLVESGRPCYCGKFGCSEQYLSGLALEHSYLSRASALEKLSGVEIFKRADQQDPLAIASVEYYRDHLVNFLSNLSNFLDPHVIVLGGGLSQQPRIYPGLSERLSRGCFLTENPPAVLQNTCGDSAGVLGAALLGLLHGGY